MPILVESNSKAPLAQGDVLSKIDVFPTGDWSVNRGAAITESAPMLLVLSRPCLLVHKIKIVVATIKKFRVEIPEKIDSAPAEHVRLFFEKLRDGSERPDRFYLGHLPNEEEGRFAAHLDSLHTIELPQDRQSFVKSHRIATLHPDFIRDLHVRLFISFARLGFNDHNWFATGDLQLLVSKYESEISGLSRQLRDKYTHLHKTKSDGFKNEKHKNGIMKDIQSHQKKIEEAEGILAPFKSELELRGN